MAKTYRVSSKGIEKSDKTTFSNKIEKSVEPLEKSVVTLSGSGEWKQLHGVKLQVDPSGTVIKGPDIMIGRKWDDLERLSYQDTFTVMRSIARATGYTNKSFEDAIDKSNRDKAFKETEKLLDEFILKSKEAKKKFDSYKR